MSYSYQTPQCPNLEGRIMMLPKLSEIDASYTTSLPVGTGIYNHPVIILSKQRYHGKVAVFVLTSFDSTPIQSRHRDPSRRNFYLPIHPATHPDTSCVLTVAHGKFMKKQSYVNFKEMHEIPFTVLRPCWRDNDLHLDRVSYKMLVVEFWKNNVGELTVELRGHGILEHTAQPTYVHVPIPTSNRYLYQGQSQQPGYQTSSTRIFNPPISESYGTFARTSTDTIQPQNSTPYPIAPTATAARNAARVHNYPIAAHQVRQSRLARPSHIMPQQTQVPTYQWTYNQRNNDASGSSCLGFIVIVFVFLTGCYYYANNVGAN
ncbi:hypothetical protein EDB82DRAFT_511172 [Fusarium venenatum]|nr:hypothetical protein EDB82DRAFT_511172 [Fusarium venenatum]